MFYQSLSNFRKLILLKGLLSKRLIKCLSKWPYPFDQLYRPPLKAEVKVSDLLEVVEARETIKRKLGSKHFQDMRTAALSVIRERKHIDNGKGVRYVWSEKTLDYDVTPYPDEVDEKIASLQFIKDLAYEQKMSQLKEKEKADRPYAKVIERFLQKKDTLKQLDETLVDILVAFTNALYTPRRKRFKQDLALDIEAERPIEQLLKLSLDGKEYVFANSHRSGNWCLIVDPSIATKTVTLNKEKTHEQKPRQTKRKER